MRIVHSTPELQAAASKGNAKFWQGMVLTDDQGNWYTQTCFNQQLADGSRSAKQFSAVTKIEGKNVGRANETTPEQQARFEMDSIEKKQRDKGYRPEGETSDDALMLPMLAHPWKDRKHALTFPLDVQPKLDGCRCLFDGERMWSRQGKDFLPDVYNHLTFRVPDGVVIDGELMLPHDTFTFQQTMSAIKRAQDVSRNLQYHVYDVYLRDEPDATFQRRNEVLRGLLSGRPDLVIPVQTELVTTEAEMLRWHSEFLQDGYEGTIVRNPSGIYVPGHRSVDLLKHKDFFDEDFTIVGVGEGTGKFAGVIMFTCRTPEGREFDCGLVGSLDRRKEMYARRDEFVGKTLVVKFQEKTTDGIPRFPVGMLVRDADIQGFSDPKNVVVDGKLIYGDAVASAKPNDKKLVIPGGKAPSDAEALRKLIFDPE